MIDIKKRAVALGFFDGLHIAHIAVLNAVLEQKKNGLCPSVLIFDKSPSEVLTGEKAKRIMTDFDRDKMLRKLGLEIIYCEFEKIKDMSPENFVGDILAKQLNAGFVSCGYNYKFGKNGAGNSQKLADLCDAKNIKTSICDKISINGATVCSTAIRTAVESGDMLTARTMLGRPFEFTAPVFSGDKRGRLLGAPTANQYMPENSVIPKFGVYASVAEFDGKKYTGVTNIGNRPTFDGESLRSETYILGFDGDLYDKEITVKLYDFIRSETKFDSFYALKQQIVTDTNAARSIIERFL